MKRCTVGLVAMVMLAIAGQLEAGSADGLVAWYPFNGNANDESGHHHHGTVYGATPTEDRYGNENSAYYFDGSGDYVAVSDDPELTPENAMTVVAWFKPYSFNLGSYSWPAILKKVSDAEMSGYAMEIGRVYESNPTVIFLVASKDGWRTPVPYSIEPGTWYFLAGVYEYDQGADQSTIKAFFAEDFGVLQTATTTFSGPIQHSTRDLNIGRDNYNTGSSRHFHGIIDDVRIYDEALTSDQVNDLYTILEPIPGDANRDSMVNDLDAATLAIYWQYEDTIEIGWQHGDFNGDGKVTDADAAILATHWQEGVEGSAPVPEPSAAIALLSMVVVGLPGFIMRRCKRISKKQTTFPG